MKNSPGSLTKVARRTAGSWTNTWSVGEKAIWGEIINVCVLLPKIEVLTGHPSQHVEDIPLADLHVA